MKTYKEFSDDLIGKRNNRLVAKRRSGTILISAVCVLLISVLILVPVLTLGGDDIVPDQLKGTFKPSPTSERNYDSLYSSLDKVLAQNISSAVSDSISGTGNNRPEYDKGENSPVPDSTGSTTTETKPTEDSYSDTNLQVIGVDEADIIKTDGKYIYVLTTDNHIIIAAANNGKLTFASKIEPDGSEKRTVETIEMYLSGNRLIVISSIYEFHREEVVADTATSEAAQYSEPSPKTDSEPANDTVPESGTILKTLPDSVETYETNKDTVLDSSILSTEPRIEVETPVTIYREWNEASTRVTVYDISDRNKPIVVNVYEQGGSYVSSRMINGNLYLLTQQYLNNKIEKDNLSTYVPQYTLGNTEKFVSPKDIFVNEQYGYSRYNNPRCYLVVSGIDTSGKVSLTSIQAVFGCGNTIYCSQNSIYTVAYSMLVDNEHTVICNASKIYRFSIKDGKVSLDNETVLPGTVLNQFSMDEYNGYFRIATTSRVDRIYNAAGVTEFDNYPVYDGQLSTVNEISTTVNTVYVLNTNLVIIGKTKPLAQGETMKSVRFDGNLGYVVTFKQVDPLFAIDFSDPSNPKVLSELKIPGYSEYMQTFSKGLLFGIGRDAGGTNFLKLSMFDVGNSENVTELHTFLLEGVYYSPAEYNHKAILVNAEKNLIAFASEKCYYIFSYSPESGFTQKAVISSFDVDNPDYYYRNIRGIFIGDYFYVIYADTGVIVSYNLTDFEKVDILK